MKNINILFAFFLGTFFLACGNLEKEIELDLPQYEPKLVVECYLEPGQPFTLSLSKSVSYFDPFAQDPLEFVENILEDSAQVVISWDNASEWVVLENQIFIHPNTGKLLNYFANEAVPEDYDTEFKLTIVSKDGEILRSYTKILPPVQVDSLVVEFNDIDTMARVLTYFQDNLAENNYYRRMLHNGSLDTIPDQDFVTTDDFVDDGTIVFGSAYDYEKGDIVFSTLVHIDQAYFDFLISAFGAVDANGNPFAQPGTVFSNIETEGEKEALGIFTGLSMERITVLIE